MTRRTSSLGYYVRGAGEELTELAGMDAGATVDTINNLDHLQDELAQHGANHVFPATSPGYWSRTPTAASTFELLDYLPGLPVPIHVQSDGSSARVVVTLVAYVNGGTGTFRVSLAKLRIGVPTIGSVFSAWPVPPIAGATTTGEVLTSSLTATTLRTTVYVDRVLEEWRVPMDLSGSRDAYGNLSTVAAYMGQIEIWSSMSDATKAARVVGVSVREYVG